MIVSGSYELVPQSDWKKVADELSQAWMHPEIPVRNWEVTRSEREAVVEGNFSLPVFATFLDLVRTAIGRAGDPRYVHAVLEVGAGSAFYGEVLRLSDVPCFYQACDYSPAFKEFAGTHIPLYPYTVAEAINLPFAARSRDVVVLGGCLLHIYSWKLAICEAARVASDWVIATRVPITRSRPTEMWRKVAYDVPCFEWVFSEPEFLSAAEKFGLGLEEAKFVSGNPDEGHYSYLFRRLSR